MSKNTCWLYTVIGSDTRDGATVRVRYDLGKPRITAIDWATMERLPDYDAGWTPRQKQGATITKACRTVRRNGG